MHLPGLPERPEDDTSTVAVENNSPEFGRRIHAAGRYAATRDEWARTHGPTLKDLRELTGPTHPAAPLSRRAGVGA